MPLLRKREKRPFLLPWGVALAGERGGGVAKAVREGYKVEGLRVSPYAYVIEVIVSRERVFPLFTALSTLVGPPCMAIIEDRLKDPPKVFKSTICTKKEALDAFTQHSFQLVNDGFTAFGLASETFEAFIGDHKDITVYCNSSRQATGILKDHGIPMDDKLVNMGAGPHYHVQLPIFFEDGETNDKIRRMCEPIPAEEVEKFNSNPERYKKFFQEVVETLSMSV